jgi:hypothetical protein
MERSSIVERAFELAREGNCASIEHIRRRLSAELYSNVDSHLSAPALRKQLAELLRSRRT